MITIEQPGPLATVQDLGRPGYARLGVPPSGAADRTAHRLANRLVGNRDDDATIETTLGGLSLVTDRLAWVAVTGAPTQLLVNDRPSASHCLFAMAPGDRLTVETPPDGVRNYIAIRGGFKIGKVLGSRSGDLLSGLGPAPLKAGQQLNVARPHRQMPGVELVPPNAPRKVLELTPGPRRDWFTEDAWQSLLNDSWPVGNDADRVAIRLEGRRLTRRIDGELAPEGLVRGAIQVPSAGQPLIFLTDHPVTGGYPVIAVLTDRSADHAAQLRPGDFVRFALRRHGGRNAATAG